MIELGYTNVTNSAMFGTGWLNNLACFTLVVLFVKNSIIVVIIFLYILRYVFAINFSRRNGAGLVVNPVTHNSHRIC